MPFLFLIRICHLEKRHLQHEKEKFHIFPRGLVWTGKNLLLFILQFS